jgi:hypothetical protein
MKNFGFGLISLIIIGASGQATAQLTYDLTLQGGTGSFTIDAPPPGVNLTGVFLEAAGGGTAGNELTAMSFDFGGDIFDLSNENSLGTASVRFDPSSGDLTSIVYLGTGNGETLDVKPISMNGVEFSLAPSSTSGSSGFSSSGTVTAALVVPEPASMGLMMVALAGMAAARRRRQV